MTMRITVSLPDRLVEHARRQVETHRASSVSAYIASLIEADAPKERLADVLSEWLADAPPLTPEEEEWIENAEAAARRAAQGYGKR